MFWKLFAPGALVAAGERINSIKGFHSRYNFAKIG